MLQNSYQTENVDIVLVIVKMNKYITDLQSIKSLPTPYLLRLKEDLQSDTCNFTITRI